MPNKPNSTEESLIPASPVPAGAEAFSKQVQGLLDGQPKDEATAHEALQGMDEMLDTIAAGLYTLASMLVGEGEEGIRLVETAVARTEVSACDDALQARKNSQRALCGAAIETIEQRHPGSLAAPEGIEPSGGCIEEDDLAGAGISSDDLESMLSGPNRERVRKWLASLPTELRVVFALRAVAGFTADETAGLLSAHGGHGAVGWTTDGVRLIFRQALCSLASQLLHSTTSR
jgi:hypothetical protein